MGVYYVVLQDEWDKEVSEHAPDRYNIISNSIPGIDDESYCCLRFINPYGDTIFNYLQARLILKEWDGLRDAFFSKNADNLWEDVRKLIELCSNQDNAYLKFVGIRMV